MHRCPILNSAPNISGQNATCTYGGETHVTVCEVWWIKVRQSNQPLPTNYLHAIVALRISDIFYVPCVAGLLSGTSLESTGRSCCQWDFTPPCQYSLWSVFHHSLIAFQLYTYLISSTPFRCRWGLAIPTCSTCQTFTTYAKHPSFLCTCDTPASFDSRFHLNILSAKKDTGQVATRVSSIGI